MNDNKLTSKQKLDEILGIKDEQSIDQFLNDLTAQTSEVSNIFSNIDDNIKNNIQTIDNNLNKIQSGKINSILALQNMDLSMKEVEDLINLSKEMFKHIYENIVSSDLLDSELISASAKLLESIHINIAEFLQMYRDRQFFIEKIKIMIFQQEQKKELLSIKHKYDLEKITKKLDTNTVEATDSVAYSTEDILRLINKHDEENNS